MSKLNLEAIKALLEGPDGVFWTRISAIGVVCNADIPALVREVERLRELASRLNLDNQEVQGANNLLANAVQERDKRIAALEQERANMAQAILDMTPAPEAGPDDVLVSHGPNCLCDTCCAAQALDATTRSEP